MALGIPDIAVKAPAPWAKMRESWRRALNPATEAEALLAHRQLQMIRGATKNVVFILPVVAGLLALYRIDQLPEWRALGWWAILTATCVGAEVYGRLVKIHDLPPTIANVRKLARVYTISTVLVSLAWVAIMPALSLPGDAVHSTTLLLLVAASLASGVSVNAPFLPAGQSVLLIYGMSLLLGPFLMNTWLGYTYEAMAAAYVFAMLGQLNGSHETTRKMFELEHERVALIDELRGAKDDSDLARERAETASRAKSQFLANMSHELRTPLNAILGFSEMIQSGVLGGHPERQKEYSGLIHQSGRHLLALINDILDLAKIEAGAMQLRDEDVDIGMLMQECVDLMDGRAASAGIFIELELFRLPKSIRGEERALKQIVLNLLSNAMKFTPAGGTVTAFARCLPNRGGMAFGVRDTGVGIAQDELVHVFEKFGQGRHDVVMADKGTGLGLSIVKGLVELHHGHVTLESRVGHGTTVTIHLPEDRLCAAQSAAS
ncbi:MAG: sensor histidine kinase [Alphaproteobacteria bacterium]|nr:sensor histidine kinase [Alphaproteobacteria bacterium]